MIFQLIMKIIFIDTLNQTKLYFCLVSRIQFFFLTGLYKYIIYKYK